MRRCIIVLDIAFLMILFCSSVDAQVTQNSDERALDRKAKRLGLDKEFVKLHEHALKFYQEERFDLAYVLWSKMLLEFINTPKMKPSSEEALAFHDRLARLEQLLEEMHVVILLKTDGLEASRQQASQEFAKRMASAKDDAERLKLWDEFASNVILNKLAADYQFHLAKRELLEGKYTGAFNRLFLLYHICPDPSMPHPAIKQWLDAAEKGIVDPNAAEAIVRKLVSKESQSNETP